MTIHADTCPLSDVGWLRHAITAAGLLIQEDPEPSADRTSAMSLMDTLAHLAELKEWSTVTLGDVASQATLMDSEVNRERFKVHCTCGALTT